MEFKKICFTISLCVEMPTYEVFSGPCFPVFGKIWTRKNSVFGHFAQNVCAIQSVSRMIQVISKFHRISSTTKIVTKIICWLKKLVELYVGKKKKWSEIPSLTKILITSLKIKKMAADFRFVWVFLCWIFKIF